MQQAETILVRDEAPIIPIYFYVGFNYYNPAKIKGIYPNILDDHPLNAIWKVKDATETAMNADEPCIFSGAFSFSCRCCC